MAHDQIHDAADQTAKLQRQVAGPQAGQMPGQPGPAIAQLAATPGIVANPLLNGRGNGPVRAAVLQRLQQTHGNRAVQRMMAQGRSRLPAVQRTEGGEQAAGPQASGGGGGALTVGNGLSKDTPLIPPGPLPVAEGAGPASGATAGATPDANAPV